MARVHNHAVTSAPDISFIDVLMKQSEDLAHCLDNRGPDGSMTALQRHVAIHDGLNQLATGTVSDVDDDATAEDDDQDIAPAHQSDSPLIDGENDNAEKTDQQRNDYAVKVLAQIGSKLSGQTSAGKLSVAEQVTKVVAEATDVDRLCQMYEGWSAWI